MTVKSLCRINVTIFFIFFIPYVCTFVEPWQELELEQELEQLPEVEQELEQSLGVEQELEQSLGVEQELEQSPEVELWLEPEAEP